MSKKSVDVVDAYVGERIRFRRISMGLTQSDLAEALGVTYQQMHKYERGINRVSAGRLYQFAQTLGVDVGYLYEGMDSADKQHALTNGQRLALNVSRDFIAISDQNVQKAIASLCRAFVEQPVKPGPPVRQPAKVRAKRKGK